MPNDYFTPANVPPPVPPREAASVGIILSPGELGRIKRGIRAAGNRNGLLLLGLLALSNGIGTAFLLLLGALPAFRGLSASWQTSLRTLASYLAMYAAAIPLLLLVNRVFRTNGASFPISFQKPAMRGGELAKWCLIAFGGTYAVNYVFNFFFLFLQALGVPLHAPSLVLQPTLFDNVVTLLFFAAAAPLCEELFFRGALLGNARAACGDWCAVVLVGVMFGLTHMNYQQLFYAAALGIFAGWLSIRARSIWPAVLVHFLLNLVGAVQSVLLSRVGADDLGGLVARLAAGESGALPLLAVLGISFLCMAAAVAGCVLLAVELARRRAALRLGNTAPVAGKRKALWYFTAPGTLAFVLAALALTLYNAFWR